MDSTVELGARRSVIATRCQNGCPRGKHVQIERTNTRSFGVGAGQGNASTVDVTKPAPGRRNTCPRHGDLASKLLAHGVSQRRLEVQEGISTPTEQKACISGNESTPHEAHHNTVGGRQVVALECTGEGKSG